jgi:integrase
MVSPVPVYAANLTLMDKASRDMLDVSFWPGGEVLSIYGGDTWEFWPYIQTNNKDSYQKNIRFSIMLPDGRLLTDSEHAGLLESTKAFLYTRLCIKHPRSGLTPKHAGLIKKFEMLRSLLQWMAVNGHQRFADLTPEDCMKYALELKQRELKPGTILGYLLVVEDLYLFRNHLADSLLKHPWPKSSAYHLAGLGTSSEKGTTEKIPDWLTRKLFQGVLRYVEGGYGEQLLACQDAYNACQNKTFRSKNRAIKEYLEVLQLKNIRAVNTEINQLYTACYAVIDLFSGLRDSEMGSLKTGCYREHEGWDGAVYGWISGLTYKTVKNPMPAEWMVPPVVKKAVKLAEKVSAPIRAGLEDRIAQLEKKIRLDYAKKEQRLKDEGMLHMLKERRELLFLNMEQKGMVSPWCGSSTNRRLKELARHLGLLVEDEDLAQVMDRDHIRVGDVWPLAPHQFRKTFAVYVARNAFGDLLYLRRHFKHWSLDMTLYYAVADLENIDNTLLDEILVYRDEFQVDIIAGWMDSDNPLTGEGATGIKEFRQREEVRAVKDHRELARKLAEGFFIRGTGHSWCTAEQCKGLGIYNVLECRDCKNRLIDRTHLQVWLGIRSQQIELLQMDDLGDPMWQRAKDHLLYAEQVLRDLEVVVELYPVPPMPSERNRNFLGGI